MNTENKIAEQAAEIANLNLVLAERKAKIAELMGEAARAEIAGAPAHTPLGNPRDWLMDGSLLYRLSDDGINCDEINVTMAHGSRGALEREAYAAGLLCLICESDSKAAPAAPSEQAEKLMADMDTMRDEYASLSNALAFWLPTVPEQAGAIQDRIVHDVFFLGEHGEPKSAQDLGWITLNVAQSATPAAPLPELTGPSIGDDQKFNELLEHFYTTAYSFAGSTPNPVTQAARVANIDSRSAASQSPAPAQPTDTSTMEDPILVPRGLIGAACYVLRKNKPDCEVLKKLRALTFAPNSSEAAPAQRQEPSLKDSLAEALHYPGCWDVMAYPALSDALSAVYDHFKCSECAPAAAPVPLPVEPQYKEAVRAAIVDLFQRMEKSYSSELTRRITFMDIEAVFKHVATLGLGGCLDAAAIPVDQPNQDEPK